MPIHNWAKAPTGLFHHFHQQWVGELCDALNDGVLSDGHYALVDQRSIGLAPDVLALRITTRTPDSQVYAQRANRIAVRNVDGEVVAIIEVVSPGNKDSRHAIHAFIAKAVEFLRLGVHLMIVDLFPPTPRDPQGIHKAIWDEIQEEPFELPEDKRLTLVSYAGGDVKTAYVEPMAGGDELTAMPLLLTSGRYVLAPLELSYMSTWKKCPAPMREIVERS